MDALEQLKRFIPSIKGISASNRAGLLHLAERAEREHLEKIEQLEDEIIELGIAHEMDQ